MTQLTPEQELYCWQVHADAMDRRHDEAMKELCLKDLEVNNLIDRLQELEENEHGIN